MLNRQTKSIRKKQNIQITKFKDYRTTKEGFIQL